MRPLCRVGQRDTCTIRSQPVNLSLLRNFNLDAASTSPVQVKRSGTGIVMCSGLLPAPNVTDHSYFDSVYLKYSQLFLFWHT